MEVFKIIAKIKTKNGNIYHVKTWSDRLADEILYYQTVGTTIVSIEKTAWK